MVIEVKMADVYFKHKTNNIDNAKPGGKAKWETEIEVYNKYTDKLVGVTTYLEKERIGIDTLFVFEEKEEKC